MTVAQLLNYLSDHCKFDVLDGDVAQTLAKARAGTHRDPIMGEILAALSAGAGGAGLDSAIERADATLALGPLRLRYMKDDAPVRGFRMVESVVHEIDGAFNEEALRQKYGR